MRRPPIEFLESRLLFSSVTLGTTQTLDTVGSSSLRQAITQVGNGDFLTLYNTPNSLSGIIFDATGHVVVPKFTVATFPTGFSTIFGNVAVAAAPGGNADFVYTIFNPDGQTFHDVALVGQVSSTGTVLIAPTLVDSSTTHSQTQAAIAVAQDGTAAVSFTDSMNVGASDTNIEMRVFNSSLVPVASSRQLTATNTNSSVFQSRSNSTIVFNNGNFNAAWYQETLTPQIAVAGQEIDGNSVTLAGDFNGDGTADLLVTGNSHDTLGQPFLVANPTGLTLYYAVQAFTPAPSFTFGGSTLFDQALSGTLSPIGSPNTLNTTIPNAENVIGSVVSVNDFNGDGSSDIVFCDSGQNGGNGLVGDSCHVFVYHTTDGGQHCTLTSDTTTSIASGVSDPLGGFVPTASGTVAGVFVTTAATPATTGSKDVLVTTVDFDPAGSGTTGGTGDDDSPSFTVSFDFVSFSNEAVFTISLNNAAPDKSFSSVHYTTRDGTALSDFNYQPMTGVAELNSQNPSMEVDVKLTHEIVTAGNKPETFFLDLSNASKASIEKNSAEADLENITPTGGTTDPGITKTQTFTSAKTLVVTGNNKLPTTLGLKGPGTAKLVLNADKTVDVFITGSTAQTQFVVKGDAYTIRNFTCNGPLGKVSASGVNVTGNIIVNGCNSAAFGNVKDNHLIKLGKLTNAVLSFAQVANSKLTATGSIKSLTVTDWAGGSIAVPTIGALVSAHDLNADLSVTTVARISVAGSLGGTSPSDVRHLRATQSFGAVTAGSIIAADIYAGVKPTITTLPTSRKQFASPAASIKSLATTGTSPAVIDSIVAAPVIGTIKLTGLVSTNATPFGVVAERITSYMRDSVSMKNIFSKKRIDAVDQYVAQTI